MHTKVKEQNNTTQCRTSIFRSVRKMIPKIIIGQTKPTQISSKHMKTRHTHTYTHTQREKEKNVVKDIEGDKSGQMFSVYYAASTMAEIRTDHFLIWYQTVEGERERERERER